MNLFTKLVDSDTYKELLIESARTHLKYNIETGFVFPYCDLHGIQATDVMLGKKHSIILGNFLSNIALNGLKRNQYSIIFDLHHHSTKKYFRKEPNKFLVPSTKLASNSGDLYSLYDKSRKQNFRQLKMIAGIKEIMPLSVDILVVQQKYKSSHTDELFYAISLESVNKLNYNADEKYKKKEFSEGNLQIAKDISNTTFYHSELLQFEDNKFTNLEVLNNFEVDELFNRTFHERF